MERAELCRGVRRLVVKVGSGVLSRGTQCLQVEAIQVLAKQIASLMGQGVQTLLVSSGAVMAGMERLERSERPRSIPLKQAAAAIGQSALMVMYEEAFAPFGIKVAQVLITQEDVRDRIRYLNARNTLFTLLGLGVIPIVNENDTVAVDEIKFGDNDILSALVASVVDADLLVMLTDQEGLYTADPRTDPRAELVRIVSSPFPADTFWAGPSRTAVGIGGMVSKVEAARVATTSHIPAMVANGLESDILSRLIAGESVGTLFLPQAARIGGRKRWLAFATRPQGGVQVDAGAKRALIHQGRSLLPSGVQGTVKQFRVGDVVSILGGEGEEFARGLVNYSAEEVERIKGRKSSEIEGILGYKHSDEVIHRDNLVVLEVRR
ncbi:MAG: glutamate 5-kinase [Candidatus Methylomirabilales bacterium]